MTILPNCQARSSIPNHSKVFDQSIIYLFKESTNKIYAVPSIESDTTTTSTNVEEWDAVLEVQVEKKGEEEEKQRRDHHSNNIKSNFNALVPNIMTSKLKADTKTEGGINNVRKEIQLEEEEQKEDHQSTKIESSLNTLSPNESKDGKKSEVASDQLEIDECSMVSTEIEYLYSTTPIQNFDENDLIYTQTIEILSDEHNNRACCKEKVNLDVLSILLEKLPLHNVRQTKKYIKDNLLLQVEDIIKRKQLVKKMEQVLCINGFNCHLYIFGSTKNGIGLRGSSDIDIFIQLKDSSDRSIDQSNFSYGKIKQVLYQVDSILGGDQRYLEVLTGPDGGSDITIQTTCHRHMRVPITRLMIYLDSKPHPSSSNITVNSILPDKVLQCDLNANSALGIDNTKLIRFLCKFEPRFLVLNVLLRYWSKYVAHLNRPDALTSYALTNMILFFCQIRRPRILPPIDYFVKLSTKLKIVNDWRCDFCKDQSKIDFRTQNTESIMQLFIGFFRFYNSFNFRQNKISTRYGRYYKVDNYNNYNNDGIIVQSRRNIMYHSPIVHIMDPFEQNHNLTARMRLFLFNRMCLEFSLALERYGKYL